MSMNIKSFEQPYPTSFQIYKYFKQSNLKYIFNYFRTYEITIDSVPFNMRKIYANSILKNSCDKFMQQIENVNDNDYRKVFREFDSLLKNKIVDITFKRDQHIDALQSDQQQNIIRKQKREIKILQKDLKMMNYELKEKNKIRWNLLISCNSLQNKKQAESKNSLNSDIHFRDETNNSDENLVENSDENLDKNRNIIFESLVNRWHKIKIDNKENLIENQNEQLERELAKVKHEKEEQMDCIGEN